MFKLYIVLALAVAGASAQLAPQPNSEAAPEPYSYGYETDSHSAAEQRDPSGKVTGFYTIVDADGRQRRVEYIADEAGFRAKIATNELGTKSENSADVEIQAAPPTEAQLAPVAPVVRQQTQYVQAAPQVVRQQQVVAAPVRSQAISYQVQPASQTGYGYYGYNAGQYGTQYAQYPSGYGYGYGYQPYGYGGAYTTTATSAAPAGYGYTTGYTTGSVGNYNNHLPSQYYRSVQQGGLVGGQNVVGGGVRYVTSGAPAVGYSNQGTYRSYSTIGGAQPIVSGSGATTTSGQLVGSSNYIVLKKREAEQKK